MIVERIALGLLVIFAALMGTNLISATDRFTVAQQAYDGLDFELEQFVYNGPREPVDITLRATNPVDHDIIVVAFELTILANSHSVGGAQPRPNQLLRADGARQFEIEGGLNDIAYMREIQPDTTIEWLVLARSQIRVDEDLQPVWIEFSFRAETPAG